MKYKEIYIIVCSYHLEDTIQTIPFEHVLRRLGEQPILSFWETTENYRSVIQYNIERGLRVSYRIIKKRVKYDYILNQCLESGSDGDLKIVLDSVILKIHNDIIDNMDYDTFKSIFSNYGNNYIKQLKRKG